MIKSLLAATVTALAVSTPAYAASDYPSRPIHLVVPYSAGGPTDFSGRAAAKGLSERLPQPVIVENKPGAGGRTATKDVMKADPDGYTLLVGTSGPLVVSPAAGRETYSPTKDLVAIAVISRSPQLLAVSPDFPAKSIDEFIAYARANPGKINVGSAGTGTTTHLATELLKSSAKIDLVHVPYKGTSKAVPDVMGGAIEAIIGDVGVLLPLALEGRIRGLAVTSSERMEQAPDIPTMKEAGLPAVKSYNWSGVFAPAGTPDDVVAAISKAMNAAANDPAYRAIFQAQGATAFAGTPADARAFLDEEIATWTPIVKSLNLK